MRRKVAAHLEDGAHAPAIKLSSKEMAGTAFSVLYVTSRLSLTVESICVTECHSHCLPGGCRFFTAAPAASASISPRVQWENSW